MRYLFQGIEIEIEIEIEIRKYKTQGPRKH